MKLVLNRIERTMMKKILSFLGFLLFTAASGRAAVETGDFVYELDEEADNTYFTENGLRYKLIDDTGVMLVGGDVVSPDGKMDISTVTHDGKTYEIVEVEAGALMNNKELRALSFGSSVKVIGPKAFMGCRNLAEVDHLPYFLEQTVIHFSLADDARDAAICIFDMTGKQLKKLPISSGETSVSVNGWELGEGMFLYTLIVNGREIDTKRMIITK